MNCDQVFAVLTRGPFPTGDPSDAAVESHLTACTDCRRLAEALRPAARVKDERGLQAPEMIGRMVEEIVGADERRLLPGYWGDAGREEAGALLARFSDGARRGVSASRASSAAGFVARGSRTAGVGRGLLRNSRIWIMVAAVAVGLAVGGSFRYLGSFDEPPLWGGAGHRVLPANADRGAGADHARRIATTDQLIAAQHLPAACRVWPLPGEEAARDHGLGDGAPRDRRPNALAGAGIKHSLASFTHATEHQACCTHCHHAGAGKEVPISAGNAVRNNCKLCHSDMPRAATETW